MVALFLKSNFLAFNSEYCIIKNPFKFTDKCGFLFAYFS